MRKMIMSVTIVVILSVLGLSIGYAQTSATITLESGSITIDGVTTTAPPEITIEVDPGAEISWGDDDLVGTIELCQTAVEIDLTPPERLTRRCNHDNYS